MNYYLALLRQIKFRIQNNLLRTIHDSYLTITSKYVVVKGLFTIRFLQSWSIWKTTNLKSDATQTSKNVTNVIADNRWTRMWWKISRLFFCLLKMMIGRYYYLVDTYSLLTSQPICDGRVYLFDVLILHKVL